jgi:hypothetical protein
MESQVVPEDEPVISLSASTAQIEDDEVLPYEVRPAQGNSGFRIPDSEAQSAQSGVRSQESEVESPKSEVRSSESEVEGKSRIQNPDSEAQGKSGVRSPESGVQNAQSETRTSESEVEGKSRIQNPESEIPAAGPDAPPSPQQPKLFEGSEK